MKGLNLRMQTGMTRTAMTRSATTSLWSMLLTGQVVETYRLQLGDVAGKHFGYYSEQEFDFTPYEGMRSQIVELGRACIHREHRSPRRAEPCCGRASAAIR